MYYYNPDLANGGYYLFAPDARYIAHCINESDAKAIVNSLNQVK